VTSGSAVTGNGDQDSDADFAARVEGLLSGVEELKSRLEAASRSEIALPELLRSMEAFGRDHGPLLRQVAATVLESLRLQALQQAYAWRDQLSRALDAQAQASQEKKPNS
jgi:hypothetical protein